MTKDQDLRDAILDAQAEAALGGHDVGPFETVEEGYQATCRQCGESSWIDQDGLRHDTLDDSCPGRPAPPTDDHKKPFDTLKDVSRGTLIAFAVGVLLGCWVLRFVSFRVGLLVLATVVIVGLVGLYWQRSRTP
jgi:hypothetical protein